MYRNFANLFFKLSVNTFYEEISKFQQKGQELNELDSYFARDSLTLLRTSVSAIFSFAPKIDNAAIAMLQCLLRVKFIYSPCLDLQESSLLEKKIFFLENDIRTHPYMGM